MAYRSVALLLTCTKNVHIYTTDVKELVHKVEITVLMLSEIQKAPAEQVVCPALRQMLFFIHTQANPCCHTKRIRAVAPKRIRAVEKEPACHGGHAMARCSGKRWPYDDA